ncbi:MAG: MYXO-CTERM sorting domain-containing protein [Polyangiales bacterium]
MRSLGPVALACALLSLTPAARGNGRFPAAQQVFTGLGAGRDVVVLRATFGLIVSRDGGETFGWACEEALFAPFAPAKTSDPPVTINPQGDVVFGFEWGVHALSASCGVDDARLEGDPFIVDLASSGDLTTVYAVEAIPGEDNAVWVGDATTLRLERRAVQANVSWRTVDVAPSDVSRVYLSGRDDRRFAPVLFASDDGARSLRPLPLPASDVDDAWVSGVSPRDAAVVFVRSNVGGGSALFRSADAGATWSRVAGFEGPMLGFAMSDDGATVWVSGPRDGLWASVDGGASFERRAPLGAYCLHQRGGVLWACGDWVLDGFALGRSTDGGATFTPALRFQDLAGPLACGLDGCDARWPPIRALLTGSDGGVDAGDPVDASRPDVSVVRDSGRSSDAPAGDAGVTRPPETTGCGCRAAAPSSRWGALVLGLTALLRRRRRRR